MIFKPIKRRFVSFDGFCETLAKIVDSVNPSKTRISVTIGYKNSWYNHNDLFSGAPPLGAISTDFTRSSN